MGKVKQWAEDTGQLNEPFWYYEGMQELADIEHEHAVKNGNASYRLTETEYETYIIFYMEGKLCGEQQNTALTSTEKYQLEQWANTRWPSQKTKHAKMSKKQLYAIWYSN